MSKKIIIFIIPYHSIGGAERVHLNIIKALKCKPIIFFDKVCSEVGKEFKENAHCFLTTSDRRRKYALLIIRIISYIFQLTIFGCNSLLFYKYISKLKGRVKSIDLTHAFSYPEKGMETISLPYVSLIDKRIVINQKTKDDFKSLYIKNNIDISLLNRISIIPNGLPIVDFENQTEIRFENFVVGFVGRNSQEKRPELFLNIVKNNNFRAKIIGDNFDIFKKDFPNVNYFENCNDGEIIRKQFSEISLLIVTSNREGFPLVIMEAMELGIPVIATNVGSISEHISNDRNGYVGPVDAFKFLNFSSEMIKKIANDKELYFKLSSNARKYACANFDIKHFNFNYRKLFYD